MTEQELRALVRDAIGRQLASGGDASSQPGSPSQALTSIRHHHSHGLFVLPATDSACVIEPTVQCNHCGYCKSYGH